MVRVVWVFVFIGLCTAPAAATDVDCKLQPPAVTLDAKRTGSDHLFVRAEFAGRKTHLLLDTGGAWSLMKERLADELALKKKLLQTVAYVDIAGGMIDRYVTVPSFKLGNLVFGKSDYLIVPKKGDDDIERWGGTIGAERLSDYDVHIDNVTKTVALYRPDRCSGRVLPWTGGAIRIPFSFGYGVPELRVTVLNESVRAVVDTGSSDTLMDLDLARRAFGLTEASPGMESLSEETMISGKKRRLYSYRFKTLNVSGIELDDVRVILGDFSETQLVLGMTEISKLHLFIAFKRRTMYAAPIAPRFVIGE